jgi:hypothetical protein
MSGVLADNILHAVIHRVGNKANEENLFLSKANVELDDEIKSLLLEYFIKPFKSDEFFNFFHENELSLNEVYVYANKIFENPDDLHEQSVNLAKYLYECSNHPKIKGGEFYVVYFNDCFVDGQRADAIGLFKSENKETFLKVNTLTEGFEIKSDLGINIQKLDKGCMIFNTEKEEGFLVSMVDNTNKGAEAQYWIDDFLHLTERKDEYYNTHNAIALCKTFITKEMPQHFEVSKADQVDLLNKSVKFFKDHDSFDFKEFSKEVIAQPDIIDNFNDYKTEFQKNREIEFEDNFIISEFAVKKQAKVFKSILKLDKNFHIYIHGNRELIEQGIDEDGRKYYKIFYEKES